MTHNGQSNFAIWLLDTQGNTVDLLVNDIGPFDGSTAVGIQQSENYLLNVTADGNWTVVIMQPAPVTDLQPPLTLSENGQKASDFFHLSQGLIIFRMTHDGQSNFAIWLLDTQGNTVDLLVNDIGPFDGSTAVGIQQSENYLLNVTADGNWTVVIMQPAPVMDLQPPLTLSGKGQKASDFFHLSQGLIIFRMTHDGQSNFAIWLLDTQGNTVDLLVNDIGPFDGSTAVGIQQSENYLLNVTADGNWAVTIEE